jgi:muramoyltetrapeptide carboxypeptidase
MKKILFIAPSGAITHEDRLNRAAAYFSAHGWQVQASDNVWKKHQRFAGDDDLRLQELHAAACSDAQVVMAVRGGYGLTRLLGRIDWDLMRTAKKIWVGHSDFTAFHLALLAQTKASSLAGPMACYDFGSESISPFTERHFWRVLEGHEVSVKIKALRQPKLAVTGRLWGGNLTVLSSLVGTPYWPQLRGGILFLEDIHEHPYRIERMLYQLEQAGYLKQQRAVLLGDFSGYQLSAHDNGYDFERMVAHLRERFEVPIFTGLPFGHCPDKLTLPVGARASVVSERGGYRLIFSRH